MTARSEDRGAQVEARTPLDRVWDLVNADPDVVAAHAELDRIEALEEAAGLALGRALLAAEKRARAEVYGADLVTLTDGGAR